MGRDAFAFLLIVLANAFPAVFLFFFGTNLGFNIALLCAWHRWVVRDFLQAIINWGHEEDG